MSLGLHTLVLQHLSLLLLVPESPLEKLPLPTFSLWGLSRHTPGLVHQCLLLPCCCSVTRSRPTLRDPMDCSISGSSVLHYLLEFAQIHVHWISDAVYLILCCPLLLLPSIFPSIRVYFYPMHQVFASGGQSIGASVLATILPMNIQSWFPLGLTGLISLQSKELSRVFSSTTVWKPATAIVSRRSTWE